MCVAVVASELGHQAGDHHPQVSEGWDEGQGTGGLVEEQPLLRVEQQVLERGRGRVGLHRSTS